MHMWQVNDDGLSSLLDVAELLGVRGLKSDRRPDPSKAKNHTSAIFDLFSKLLFVISHKSVKKLPLWRCR